MRTTTDVVRSLNRYASEILGEEWEVRFAEAQETFERPFALVGPAGPALASGRATIRDMLLPATINCYPLPGEDPEDAMLKALEVDELLFRGLEQGVGYGGPRRVPLWDFEGVPLDRSALTTGKRKDGDFWHGDYIRLNDVSINRVRDPNDPRLYAVVADIRCGWRRRGRLPSEGETMRSVKVSPERSF